MTQKVALVLGEDGCYLFCILKRFGKDEEALRLYPVLVKERLIRSDCFVLDAARVAEKISGEKWEVVHAPASYVCGPDEWEVQRWEREAVGKVYSHFTLPDWDPLGSSMTRTLGRLVSKRVFKRRK